MIVIRGDDVTLGNQYPHKLLEMVPVMDFLGFGWTGLRWYCRVCNFTAEDEKEAEEHFNKNHRLRSMDEFLG